MKSARSAFAISNEASGILQEAVQTGEEVAMTDHTTLFHAVVIDAAKKKEEAQTQLSSRLLQELPAAQHGTLDRIVRGNASGWLTMFPLHEEGSDLSATQIRGQLAIRYHHEPSGLPPLCDGCGAPFSLQHCLDSAKGGLVKKGHNDLRDSDARIADVAWNGVVVEPILVPENDKKDRPMIQVDWMARGVWEANRVAFFDNRIIDADAPSYVKANLPWDAIATRAVSAKKSKHRLAAEEL